MSRLMVSLAIAFSLAGCEQFSVYHQSLVNLLAYCENQANQCPAYEVPNIRQQLAEGW